jgi:transposase
MSTKPISMNKLKSILQLKYSSGLSNRMIAKSLSISPATVSKYLKKATELGINTWPLPDDKLEEASLASKVKPKQVRKKHYPTPDWVKITEDLKLHKYLTLLITWEELKQENNDLYYSYNHFCRLYKYWTGTQRLSMRQTHHAGEKLFVDYCGPTIDIVSPTTGEVRTAQVFVAALGASNYTYCEATWSQKLEDWVMSHARCFEFLGGLPQVVIPDNLKSAVTRTCRYDPDLNPTYHQLATHYDIAIIPARPYKPKDKSKAEVAVQIVERWIMARLRKVTFHTLKALNQQIKELLTEMNNLIA